MTLQAPIGEDGLDEAQLRCAERYESVTHLRLAVGSTPTPTPQSLDIPIDQYILLRVPRGGKIYKIA
eukprot:841667-Prorocentrum_minimum.AAC.1